MITERKRLRPKPIGYEKMMYKKIFFIIIFLAIILARPFFCFASDDSKHTNSAKYFQELGNSYAEQYKNTEAMEAYKKAIELDSKMVEAYIGLGNMYARFKDYDKSIREFEAAIRLNPNSTEAIKRLAIIYLYRENRTKAVDYYKRLEKISPKDAGEILPVVFLSKYHKLEADEKGISLTLGLFKESLPPEVKPYLDEAFKLETEGKIPEAVEQYEKSLAVKESVAAYYYLSQLYLRNIKDVNKAAIYMEKVIELEPDNIAIIYSLSVLYASLGRKDDALQKINTALAGEPKNSLYLWIKGLIYYEDSEWSKALEAWDELKKYDSDSFPIIEEDYKLAKSSNSVPYGFFNELTDFLKDRTPTLEEKQSEDVVVISYKSVGDQKDNLIVLPVDTVKVFEVHLFEKRKFEELIEFCKIVIETKPDSFTYNSLARTLELKDKIDEAVEIYDEEIKAAPNEPMPYFRLKGIYSYNKKDTVKAKEYLDKFNAILLVSTKEYRDAVRKSLISSLMSEGLYFLNELQQFDKARKYFEMVLELDSGHEKAKLNLIICQFNKSKETGDDVSFNKAKDELRILAEHAGDKEVVSFAKKILDMPDSGQIEEEMYINKGVNLVLEENFEAAEVNFQKALEREKFSYQAGSSLEVIRDFNKGLLNREDVTHFFKGLNFHRGKEYQRAIDEFQKITKGNDKYYLAYVYIGIEYVSLEQDNEAIIYFNKALQINQSCAVAYWGIGSAYTAIGKDKEAEVNLEKAKELFHKAGDSQAIKAIQKAISELH